MNEEEIFHHALARNLPEERAAYLEQACAGNPALRASVEALLRANIGASGFMDPPASGLVATVDEPAVTVTEHPGTVIGQYKLLEQIGEGGFGVVFMAEQQHPIRRKVALKVLKPGMDTRQVIARFEAERQALALMDHPNIAKVHEAGETASGRPYFVMELVKGIPITDYCDQSQLPVHERLELFLPVCQAVQHAHQKGIIHRDLKPTNLLVTLHDGAPVVKVIDFGIAKALGPQLTEKTLYTGFAQMVGTPMYMSPEQAALSGLDMDTRSDIYSLGVLLYELLTGTTPFDKERLRTAAYDEMRRIIREEEPPKPSTRISTLGQVATAISAQRKSDQKRLSQLFRGELDWIVMKCLEKDRNRRYETASTLAADVQRYLDDEPVLACPPSTSYRFRKFARRNKVALATASVVGLAAVVAVAVLTTSTVLIVRALQAETEAKAELKETLEREQRDAYFHRIAWAYRELVSLDNLGRALELLKECPEGLRDWEWHYLMRLCRVEPLVLRDKTELTSVAFSPDGECLASAGGDGTVKIWNSKTGEVVKALKEAHADSVVSVAFHPGGTHVASAGRDRKVKVWDLTTGQEVFAEPIDVHHTSGSARTVAFSDDGRHLAAASDGAVKVWDWRNRQVLHTLPAFPGHEKLSITVAFSHDGRLASGSWRGALKLWDVEKGGAPIPSLPDHRHHPVTALSFSSDGGRIASSSFDRTVKVWGATTDELLHTLQHTGLVLSVAFSPDGRHLASAGEDKTVHVWDATTGREVLGLRGHSGMCGCVAFSPDGQRLASASLDGTLRVWDATPLQGDEGQETMTFSEHSDEIWSLAISPDGHKIASAGFDKTVKVWDAGTGRVSVDFPGHDQVVFCVAWQPDGRRIASAGADRGRFTVKVWDAQTGDEVFTVPAAPAEYHAVAFSPPDGRYLVTGQANGTVQVWEPGLQAKPLGTLGSHGRAAIRGVVFSRDGRHLASASNDGVVKLWDATRLDQKQEARPTLHARVPGQCLNVAFSPDGRCLATGGEQYTVKIWDVESGQELQTLRGHSGEIYTVAFSPDGRWIASAGEDSTVKVWDSRSGALVGSFRGHTALVSSVAFSLDGRQLFSGSRDKTVKVWNLAKLSSEVSDR